jgi:GGDEF domain-containing protein
VYNNNYFPTSGIQVSIQKISKYAKHFDLLVIHDADAVIPFKENAQSIFRTCEFRSIDNLEEGEEFNVHLVIVCGPFVFLKNPHLKTFLNQIQTLESVIFSPDFSTSNVLRIALSFRSLNTYLIPQNEEEFSNVLMGVFATLVKKHNELILANYDRLISEFSNNLFWVHKGGKTVYANDTLKRKFGVKNVAELDILFEDKELLDVIHTSGISQKIISKKEISGESKDYFVTQQPLKDGESLITLIPMNTSLVKHDKQLRNRMSFIELLKDAFVIHKRENEPIPVIVMYIENSDKIIEMRGEDVYNDVCKEILKLVHSNFDLDVEVAQWHKNIYTILATNISLNDLKRRLERFHQNLGIEVSVEGISPVMDSFIIDMKGVELNKAIGIIDHINQKQLLSRDLEHLVHYEISLKPQEVDDEQQAIYYLEKMIMTNTSVKLLNFYKGIRISTAAKLVKISDEMVYVSIEKIQGYAMKLEQNVVIQGANIPYDIMANVKIVDIPKKIAVLSKFEPLEASGNNRQYIRIQSDHRMHVTMTSGKSVMSGTILDISIKSIACKFSVSKVPISLASQISLHFNLPLERFDGGMVTMMVLGKVQYIQEGDEFTKVVVELHLAEPYESYLIEYIYARQQALVNEIKTIANKL